MVSTYQSLVFSFVAATNASMSLFSTKVVSTPRSPRVCSRMFHVPPYSESDATMWSPAPTRLVRARISCRVAGGDGDGTGAALDRGHAGGDGVGGGVGQAAVDVARLGEGELRGAVSGVVELERRGGVDRERRGAGGGVGSPAGVDLQGVEVLLGVGCEGGIELECHDVLLCGRRRVRLMFS
jgi:hypothetical protein